jgi:hypothetical protein
MSNGDPHLVTVNAKAYDFMAAGEFVLLRSDDGTLELQARQEPYESSKRVTINTAVVALVEQHRVQIDFLAGQRGLRARIDGLAADVTAATAIGAHSKILPHGNGFEVDFSDGTIMWATGLHDYGINVVVDPSDDVRAHSEGIIGTATSNGAQLPALSDGSSLPAPRDRHDAYQLLYTTFAGSWRVSDPDSLFTYDDRRSTADYTIAGFPREEDLVPLDQLAAEDRAFGEQACTDVTDPVLHQQCVFDAALTRAVGFATAYESTEEVVSVIAPAHEVPVTTAGPPPPSVDTTTTTPGAVQVVDSSGITIDGVVAAVGAALVHGFALEQGTVLYGTTPDCADGRDLELRVRERATGVSSYRWICNSPIPQVGFDEGSFAVWIPTGGDYDVSVTTTSVDPFAVSLTFFADTEPTIVLPPEMNEVGFTVELHGVGDTVVLELGTGDETVRWSTTGLDGACANQAYGAGVVGAGAPWSLDACQHPGDLSLGPSGELVIPLIVFSRSPGATAISVIPVPDAG